MKGPTPDWLATWLGVSVADDGEGTVWELNHAWPFPPWLTLLASLAAVGWVVYCYHREPGGARRWTRAALAAMRLAVVGLVAFMLAGFLLSMKRTSLPYLAIVIDESLSMETEDRYDDEGLRKAIAARLAAMDGGGADPTEPSPASAAKLPATRLNLAKSLLLARDAELLMALAKGYQLKLYFVAAETRAVTGDVDELRAAIAAAQPMGTASRLGQGVRSVLKDMRGAPPSALVILTDGITSEGESLAEVAAYARRKGVPLVTVGLGSENAPRDLRLADLLVDEVVFVNDSVGFEFKLQAAGYANRTVDVVLTEEQAPQAQLARQTVTLNAKGEPVGPDGQPRKLRMQYRPLAVGDFKFTVAVESLPDEIQHENNRQSRLVSVRKEPIKVLLVQSYPNFEYRYLKHMLERDDTIELHTVLQQADREYASQDKSALRVFPGRRDELFAYDAILFGDVNPTFLSPTELENLTAFVTEKGGGVVFIAGPEFTPMRYRDTAIAPLFPIELEGAGVPAFGESASDPYQWEPTDLGLASPSMQLGDNDEETRQAWAKLSPLYWLFEAPRLKPAARVLAEHPSRSTPDGARMPLALLQFVGAGKVVFHATDETWRWRYRRGDVFFNRYWVQTIRYLSRSKLLGKDRTALLSVDRERYSHGDVVRARLRFADERRAPADDHGVEVLLSREGQPDRQVALRRQPGSRGVFEAALGQLAAGQYHLSLLAPKLGGDPPTEDFLVVAPPGEKERLELDVVELQRASEATRGRFYKFQEADKLLAELPAGRQIPIEALPPIKLWNRWPVLLAIMLLLTGEWLLRKRQGML